MTEAKLTIGHIARSAGVNIETVRYYQRRGLVSLPPKRREVFGITRRRPRVGCVSSSARRHWGCRSRKCSVY
jgi:hypothetical protein